MEIKISEKRRPRIEAKLKVAPKRRGALAETYVGNISQSGIFLETPKPFAKLGEKVNLVLTLPDSKDKLAVLGKVVRVVGPNQLGKTKGVGIQILKVESRQSFLFNRLLQDLVKAKGIGCRKSPRINTIITVEFSNPREMGKCLSQNLSRGGLFLQTEAELNLGQTVSVILLHPEGKDKLELEGEIVHVRKSLQTRPNMGFTDGIGIKFVNLSKLKEEKINQFLKNLMFQKKRRKRTK